jgi:hypothetical protein
VIFLSHAQSGSKQLFSAHSTMQSQVVDPHVPFMARVCGRSMILAFLIVLVASLFPVNIRSSIWGSQISNRILDAGVLPLLGVTLLRTACFLESGVDSRRDPVAAKRLLRQRESARRLIRIGVGSLILLAIWQLPLFIGSLNLIDQQRTFESRQLSEKLTTAEQVLRQAPQPMVDETWKQFVAAGLSSSRQIIRDQEQQRKAMLERILIQRQQANLGVNQRGTQARFALVRNLARNLLLCCVYITGYWGLGKRLV